MESKPASDLKLDAVGRWSELKLEILGEYAAYYTNILRNSSTYPLRPVYVDGFAGAGDHATKATGNIIDGSPRKALNVSPPFAELHFVERDPARATQLRQIAAGRENVEVWEDDANDVLLRRIFPSVFGDRNNRALCFLDPYGLHLDWNVLQAAGRSQHAEIFLNFATLDMERNVFRKNTDKVAPVDLARMKRFWGDDTWREHVYDANPGLFEVMEEKASGASARVAQSFAERLKTHAGFGYVPDPVPMRNSRGAILFYLFFAAPATKGGRIGKDIVQGIIDRHKKLGAF